MTALMIFWEWTSLNDLAVPNDKKDDDGEGESKPSGADPFAFLTF